ncbi:PAS domain-containing protein [Streptomyces griseoincarnatus]
MWDTELRCVWANDVLTRYDGIPRERRLGLPPRASLAGDADALEETLREVLDTGACVIGRRYHEGAGGRRHAAAGAGAVSGAGAAGAAGQLFRPSALTLPMPGLPPRTPLLERRRGYT